MSSTTRVTISAKEGLPVGRIVMGNLYKPNTTNFDGQPLVVKTGPNAGQPRVDYFFALAIPKGAETHWGETAWGKKIWEVGHLAFPVAAQTPTFAWKIDDGDSAVLNKKGRKPCDNEGWPGHWILKLSGGFAPKVYREENGAFVQVTEEGFIKCGDFVEVAFDVDGNGNQNNAGVYLNHRLVCYRGWGEEISFGPNVNEMGFGQAALPSGASTTPKASALPPPPGAAAPTIPVVPNPNFAKGPNPPPPPPAAAGPKMTAKAEGNSHQAYKAAGWSDEALIAEGYMTV